MPTIYVLNPITKSLDGLQTLNHEYRMFFKLVLIDVLMNAKLSRNTQRLATQGRAIMSVVPSNVQSPTL